MVLYEPVLRMAGTTSCVIQRLNLFASSLRLPRIRLYSPYSLTKNHAIMDLANPSGFVCKATVVLGRKAVAFSFV
nr:MAG TPA: hypothetical protein [Caudoviricetes sp.]